MKEELLDMATETVETVGETVVEGANEISAIFDVDNMDVELVKELSEYSKGAMHATVAIATGAGAYKLLKNRKRISLAIKKFIDKNKEALAEVKAPKVVVEETKPTTVVE